MYEAFSTPGRRYHLMPIPTSTAWSALVASQLNPADTHNPERFIVALPLASVARRDTLAFSKHASLGGQILAKSSIGVANIDRTIRTSLGQSAASHMSLEVLHSWRRVVYLPKAFFFIAAPSPRLARPRFLAAVGDYYQQ
ncbi:hypothetical protein CkaCkLH20_12238 [Colletotrichum karsti]|uniref:Uncharacterized protein n=1 Tax=Colletotrichum karsti TaxID=1095194 RepID=A0A9P6HU22_9PEZI|nr:uncharacterized protein CkaCkLH20_12238 [Colletotrichum karsti]KAF9870274.1 hypothetical protein CkaCkLH20_12238 [Colletotrichum karsti]